ncbi:MAG: GNAT family N-acetyltransferase [Caulobacteraceae bacterium]
MAVDLIALSPEDAKYIAAGGHGLYGGAVNAAKVEPLVRNIAAAQAHLYERTGAMAPWIGYLARDPASNMMVGTCSFVGNPKDGEVEIAYFTFPGAEGRGWGAGMAGALTAMAFDAPEVSRVIAHTLQQEGTSTHILRGLGYELVGDVIDPDEGPVWRWALDRA